MSKIRIYELAKELGIENKVVIARAQELGLPGKLSHSHSLEADEADQIRRAIIRQAIGTPAPSEKVTTRVDKVTGASEAIVESRKGNVIRRRKAAPGSESTEVAAAPEPTALDSANELFVETEEVVEVAPPVEVEPEEVEEVEVEIPEVEPEPEVEEEVIPQPVEPEPEITPPAPQVVVAPAAPVAPVAVAAPVRVISNTPGTAGVTHTSVARKAVGPKVLGKIELAVKKPVKPAPRPTGNAAPALVLADVEGEEEDDGKPGKKGAHKKRTKKREISRLDLVDYEGRDIRRGPKGKAGHKDDGQDSKLSQSEAARPRQSKRVVKLSDSITVGELAKQMSLKAAEIITKLLELGVMATINHAIDKDTATLIGEEFGFQIESTNFDENAILESEPQDDPAVLKTRPPVVTVMGHVDHGKTSLLDTIRKASVAVGEHGGITQHIGAYSVALDKERTVTFIDTPGHAAFTSMRARGAKVTDIVVLVVASDDGVMPQTVEAINHAKAAGVPIVVALNKIDRPDSNPERVKKQLLEHGLQAEEWGGDTMYYPVSATKGTGIKELLEGLLLVAEVEELRANPDKRARGTIIEARQDRGRGTVVTVLVQAGTLKVSDVFVSGACSGRVRAMLDSNGNRLKEAGPSIPVEITGVDGIPAAGDDFFVVESEANARDVAANRQQLKQTKEERALSSGPISLEEFARRANNQMAHELNVLLKADVQGSLEAVRDAMEKLSTDKVKVRVLHAGVGGVNESDVQLAIASKAIIVGFGVRAEPRASSDAGIAGIELRFYRIIYELIDDIKLAMTGLLDPVKKEVSLARAEVRNTFPVPKLGTVAGCFIVDGTVKRGALLRLVRDNRVVFEGKMASLRRFKDDVKEVATGFECGIGIEGYNDIKTGDVIEVYEIQEFAGVL